MIQWWNDLTILQQIFACMAVPATLLLIIQTILLLFGMGGGGGADTPDSVPDTHMEADILHHDGATHDHNIADAASGVRLFTIRGFVAFFAVGGWLGIVLLENNMPPAFAILLSLVAGLAAMAAIAFIFKWAMRLQEQGNISLNNAIGKSAQVYITIPAKRSGTGKVTLTLQERFVELDAITDNEEALKAPALVKITGLLVDDTLIVE